MHSEALTVSVLVIGHLAFGAGLVAALICFAKLVAHRAREHHQAGLKEGAPNKGLWMSWIFETPEWAREDEQANSLLKTMRACLGIGVAVALFCIGEVFWLNGV